MSIDNIGGRSPEDIWEAEAGSVLHKAIVLGDLTGALEHAIAEFEYQDGEIAKEFVALCREFSEVADDIHIADDGSLVDGSARTDRPQNNQEDA